MNLLFACDFARVSEELEAVLKDIPDLDFTIVNGEEVLTNRDLETYDAIAFEVTTWQRHYSFYKYFGLGELLERIPLLCVVKNKKLSVPKGRLGKKDVMVNLPIQADMLQKFLDDYKLNKDLMENLARASMMVQ